MTFSFQKLLWKKSKRITDRGSDCSFKDLLNGKDYEFNVATCEPTSSKESDEDGTPLLQAGIVIVNTVERAPEMNARKYLKLFQWNNNQLKCSLLDFENSLLTVNSEQNYQRTSLQ